MQMCIRDRCSLVFLMLGVYYVDKGYTTLGALAAIYKIGRAHVCTPVT